MDIRKVFTSTTDQVRSFNRPAKLFLVATILDGTAYSGWNLFFNFYMIERGFGRDFIGLVNSVTSLAILLLGLPLGQLSDRIGRKRAMVLGFFIAMIAMFLEATVQNPALILVMAFLNGTGSALYFLSGAPFMMKVSTPQNRTLLFSLNFGLVTLSGAFGSLFAGQLPRLFGDLLHVADTSAAAYQGVLLMSVAISFLTLVPLILIKEPKTAAEIQGAPRAPAGNLWKVATRPISLKLALPNLLIGSGAALLIPYLNLFFADKFKVTDGVLGVLFSISALLTGIGSIVGPRLEGRLGSKIRAVVFTQAASLAFLLLMGFSPFFPLVVAAFLMRGTLMNMAVPLYSAFSMEQVPESEQATVNSFKEVSWQVGWLIGPVVSGIVQERYGFAPLFAATGVLYGLSCLVTWWFFGKRERKASLDLNREVLPVESLGD